jgi:hypothetical protein
MIMKEHADKALQYFISVEPSKALPLLLVRYKNLQALHISSAVNDIVLWGGGGGGKITKDLSMIKNFPHFFCSPFQTFSVT